MDLLRTPDDRFAGLEGFSYAPRYTSIPAGDGSASEIRVDYLDEGPAAAGETVLCLNGEPTWCYLYRRLIPSLVAAGHGVVAPDQRRRPHHPRRRPALASAVNKLIARTPADST